MAARIIDGKAVAAEVKERVAAGEEAPALETPLKTRIAASLCPPYRATPGATSAA